MASSSEGFGLGHGGRRDNSGRKKRALTDRKDPKEWFKRHKRIYLSTTIFHSWLEAKFSAGYGCSTDSDFAAHLLSLEYRRQ